MSWVQRTGPLALRGLRYVSVVFFFFSPRGVLVLVLLHALFFPFFCFRRGPLHRREHVSLVRRCDESSFVRPRLRVLIFMYYRRGRSREEAENILDN